LVAFVFEKRKNNVKNMENLGNIEDERQWKAIIFRPLILSNIVIIIKITEYLVEELLFFIIILDRIFLLKDVNVLISDVEKLK